MRMVSNTGRLLGCVALYTAFAGATAACMDYRPRPAGAVRDAVSQDPVVAKAAMQKLRDMGPEGLGVLMSVFDRETVRNTGRRRFAYPTFGPKAFEAACPQAESFARPQEGQPQDNPPAKLIVDTPDAAWKRLSAAFDAVAGQKDAAYSGLYWYTDLDKAKAAARESGKPILSLRLLGTLDSEFSCANSRFFRTVLYANDEVSSALRDRFVLHWQSVRPVPKVTIDMGDGRVVERTITGNSVHYVLDAGGRPLDAIPGLYGPRAFLRALGNAEQVAKTIGAEKDPVSRQALLRDWHGAQARRVTDQWERDLAAIGAPTTGGATTALRVNTSADAGLRGAPTAVQAARAAVGKSAVEFNIVRALAPRVAALRAFTTDDAWAKIAATPAHAEDAKLDASSTALVRAKHPVAPDAGRLAMAKRQQEDPILRVVGNLQRSISEDTVRNEYGFHRTIHEWFANGAPETMAADASLLNEKVYAELFLTPSTDPWLGLVPADAYSALEGDGIRIGAK